MATAVMAMLTAVTFPAPNLRRSLSLKRLDVIVPAQVSMEIVPTKDTGALIQYTNVLVGFSMEECKKDIAMRPYMILESPDGEQVTIYGGIVHRSIGYIAYRNRDVFAPGSDAYEYVWNIIREVYGTEYDAEYKKG